MFSFTRPESLVCTIRKNEIMGVANNVSTGLVIITISSNLCTFSFFSNCYKNLYFSRLSHYKKLLNHLCFFKLLKEVQLDLKIIDV